VQINVQLPDDLGQHADPAREALEAFAIEGYRSGVFTRPQAAGLLGLSRFEFNDLLFSRNVYEHAYGMDDLRADLADLKELRKEFPVRR
jgi:predicted HTH domain antitoxin